MKYVAFVCVLVVAVAGTDACRAAEVRFTRDGMMLDMGTGGSYCLRYPVLTDQAQKPTKPDSVTADDKGAVLSYGGGVKLAVTRSGAAVTLHFTHLNETARGFRMEMTLPGEFAEGATFQLQGGQAKAFPARFAGEQFVLKGEPRPLVLTPPRGAAFTLAMPYGWHQIQDGRKWNSPNFDYMLATAMPGNGAGEAYYTFKVWSGGLDKAPPEPRPLPPAPKPRQHRFALRLAPAGLAIDAGSDGQFTLNYPVMVGQKWDDIRKPVEKKVAGNAATLLFDGGSRIEVALAPADGTLTLTPHNVPAGVKSLRCDMHIDFGYSNGGAWKIGDSAETPFPAQQPAKPFLYQGHADSLTLRNVSGAALVIQAPSGSYLQLADNREWGWKIFAWQFDAPCRSGAAARVKLSAVAPRGEAAKLVDRFGQTTRADFAAKVKDRAELQADVQAEAQWLAGLRPPELDRCGGLPGSARKLGLKRTGFFHVQKVGGRWLLVDPEGNAFFHLGICGFNPSDDYTYVKGREHLYEYLPPHEGEFSSAWHPNAYWRPDTLSFHLVNTIRKFHKPYDPAGYTERMIARARAWGFNSAGAFGAGDDAVRRRANFPYAASLPLSVWQGFEEIPGAVGVFDPFSDKLRAHCEKVFAQTLPPRADDPLIIGYFLGNEPLWENIPRAVAALDASHPAKRRLAAMLQEKYKTPDAFNRAWGAAMGSFDEVAARGLAVKTPAAREDMRTYSELFLDAYFRLVVQTFRKHDKNHLLIGNRFQPGTINDEITCRLSGKYMDVISFNYYTHGFDAALLGRVRGWTGDRPMLFSEFYFSSPRDSGLIGGAKEVSSQLERGLAYRHYVEQAAALGYVVGIEWFTLVDQAVTGRFFDRYAGEAANTGLIAVTDRPWKTMLDEMIKTNYDIYTVWLGERAPYRFADPRFEPGAR